MDYLKKFFTWVIILIQSSRFFGPRLDKLLFWYYTQKGYIPDEDSLNNNEKRVLASKRAILFGTDVGRTGLRTVIALVGEPGAGKSMVANQISCRKNFVIVSADEVRVELRFFGEGYDRVQEICSILTLELVRRDYSVVLESSHIDPFKRAKLKVCLSRVGVKPAFLQVVCDDDVAVKRIIEGSYSFDSLYDEGCFVLGDVRGSKLYLTERARQMFLYKKRDGSYRELPFVQQEAIDTSRITRR